MVQRDQWDTSWGPKKLIFLIREIDDAAMAARAPMESCQFHGAIAYAACAAASIGRYIWQLSQPDISLAHDLPKISIQSSLESPKNRRMRRRRLPDPRPISEGVREPIYIRKK